MTSISLNAITGDECFIAGPDGEVDSGELTAYESIDELLLYLKQTNPITEQNLLVIHGALTEATALPEDFKDRSNNIYIIVTDPGDIEAGAIWHSECGGDVDALAAEIEHLINNKKPYDKLGIEDVFIMYGYELELGLCVNEDDVDEEIITGCKEIAEEATKLAELATFENAAAGRI